MMTDAAYLIMTMVRGIGCATLSVIILRPDALPILKALGVFFSVLAVQRVVYVLRALVLGFAAPTDPITLACVVIETVAIAVVTLLVLTRRLNGPPRTDR